MKTIFQYPKSTESLASRKPAHVTVKNEIPYSISISNNLQYSLIFFCLNLLPNFFLKFSNQSTQNAVSFMFFLHSDY